MLTKNSIRLLATVFVMAVVLTATCFAYSTDLYGQVFGLEDGKEYTVAKYDVVSDEWSREITLDENTQLDAGIWRITEVGGASEELFIQGSQSGTINFWDSEKDAAGGYFGSVTDDLVPGKWTVGTGGAYTRVTSSYMRGGSIQTVCVYLNKSKVLTPVEGGDGYAYATPIEGESNRLQESTITYSFTPEQVIPASRARSMTFVAAVVRTGGMTYTEGYSLKDAKGLFTFTVKVPESDGYEYYSVETNVDEYGELKIICPEEMKNSKGYLVAMTYAPYASCDDKIYSGNSDKAATCYVHLGLVKGVNRLEFIEENSPAPIVHDGFGIIGADPERTYQIAEATISPDGTGLTLGQWMDYTYSAGRDRDLVGIYAVRESYNGKVSDYTFAYAYGDKTERQNVIDLNSAGTHIAVCTDLATYDRALFYPAMWSGDVCSSAGVGQYSIFDHSQVVLDAYNTAKKAYDSATEETREAAKATLDREAAKLVAGMNNIKYKYAFDNAGIIRTTEADSFKFSFRCNNSTLKTKTLTTRVVAYVADRNGEIKTYEKKHTQSYATSFSYTVNFADFLPEDGWLVAFDVYPNTDNTVDNLVEVGEGGFRYPLDLSEKSYVIGTPDELPVSDIKPEGLSYENGVITGFNRGLAYEYAQFDINGIQETDWAYVTGVTELAPEMAGLIAVKFSGDGYSYSGSDYTYIYIPGNSLTSIIHTTPTANNKGETIDIVDIASAGSFNEARGKIIFNEAKWTGILLNSSLPLNHGFDRFILGSSSTPISGKTWGAPLDTTDEASLAKARADAAAASADIYYSYAYTSDEIIPLEDFESFTYRVSLRQGCFKLVGDVHTEFTFKVIDESEKLVDRTVSKPVAYTKSGTTVTVSLEDFEDISGYIVGIVIKPYVLTEGSYFAYEDTDNVDYNVFLSANCYKVNAIMPSEKPELSLTVKNAVVKVTNYNEKVTYAYSDDNGESWTAFKGDTFNAVKASASYTVKALSNKEYLESPISEPVISPAVTVVGASLVLDGSIGIKIYMDIDTDAISSMNYHATIINRDFYAYKDMLEYGEGYKVASSISLKGGSDWMTKITLDSDTGLYYTIVGIPAKDVDNISIESDLGAYMKDGQRVSFSNLGGAMSIAKYISAAKELAADGNADFIKAMSVIEALERYTAYADNYFSKGSLEEYTSNEAVTAEKVISNGALDGAEYYGTSLLLEDKVTIRHYFAVEDSEAYLAKYSSDISCGVTNGYVYYDIEDIPAQDMEKVHTLIIKDSEGKAFEISYSVANYIEKAMSESDTRLVSLINTMNDYGKAAFNYANPKPLYVKYDPYFSGENSVEAIHLYIPTEKGYIDHVFGHTVKESINADIWRLSFAYMCDDNLENAEQITTTGEWDMALILSGRPDFIGGNAHGDEKMTGIKFIVDGVETDITTLVRATEFKTMLIVQDSIGYDPMDSKTQVLKHHKEHKITHAGIRLDQKVEWLGDYSMGQSYLAMMPPAKKYTDMYYTNLTEPAEVDMTTGYKYVDGATSVTVYGKESGLYFTMTVNEYDVYIKPFMSIADNGGGAYNKMYFSFVKSGTVSKGDVWETFTHYRIEKK